MPAGCHIASCHPLIAPPSCHLVVPAGCPITSRHPLIALPSHRRVTPAGCRIAFCRPLIVPSSCQLVAPACCRIASPRPLVAPRATLLSSRRASWLLRRLLMRCPHILLSSNRSTSCCLVAPAGCRPIISRRPLVTPSSRPLIVLAGCCVACPCTALSFSHHSPSPMPSNTVECCCRHGTPPPPATAAIERRLYRPPLSHLPSIATVKCQHPHSSITAVKR